MAMKVLAKLRKELGISSMYKMAEKLGMLNNSYIYLEKKAKAVTFQTLVDIKEKCGLTWEKLGKMIEDEVRSGRRK